jgi:hypothetical protein
MRRNIIGPMSVKTVPERPDLAATRPPTALGRARRPVILATLSVRIDAHAERIAFASALESGAKLILANMFELHPYPLTVVPRGAVPRVGRRPVSAYLLRSRTSRSVPNRPV